MSQSAKTQQGVALIIALILLMVMTMSTIIMARSALLVAMPMC